jgi:hypothetical protein
VGGAPRTPFGADLGSLTGWMMHATVNTPSSISLQLERSFTRLVNVPPVDHLDYAAAMQCMSDEILNSTVLETYLMVSNKPHGVPRVTVMHSLFR